MRTKDNVEFAVWGRRAGIRQPTLIILAGVAEQALSSAYFRQCGNQLALESGWLCVSIDLPCHGKQQRPGERGGLSGWRQRAEKDEDFVAPFARRLSRVVDHLIESDMADRGRIAICGTSRGGYLAIQFAARDPRVGAAAAFAPVTDLRALSEFRGLDQQALTQRLSLAEQAPSLADRPVWICIGDQDQRVSTERAIECARRFTDAKARVALHVFPEPRGHTTPKGAPQMAADWIRDVFSK